TPAPTVTFTGVGSLATKGQGGGDTLTVVSPAGSQDTLIPGTSVDSGTVDITSGAIPPVSYTPVSFSNLGSTVLGSSLTISGATTLIYDGTTGSDTFTVAGSATAGDGSVSLANSSTPPVAQILVKTVGVTDL